MKVVLQVLREKVLMAGDKAIIVSQWTSLLQLIAKHLKNEGIHFNELNGSIPVHKRMCLVDDFNNPNNPVQVLKNRKICKKKHVMAVLFSGDVAQFNGRWRWFELSRWQSFVSSRFTLESAT